MTDIEMTFSYSANLSHPVSLWCCVLYTSSPTIPSHFHSVHSHSGGPIHRQIRGNEVSSAQFEALLWSWMWNSSSAPLCSSPAGKIRALSLKALYLCSLYGSLLSLNRFGVTFKSQLLQALTVNGHKGWKSKRNVSDISFYISRWAGMRTHQKGVRWSINQPKAEWGLISKMCDIELYLKSQPENFNFTLDFNLMVCWEQLRT